jgi:hypothetical protein
LHVPPRTKQPDSIKAVVGEDASSVQTGLPPRAETFFEVGGMVLKPKRPTLAKNAPGWGTLNQEEAFNPDSEVQDRRFHDSTTFIRLDHVKKTE